MATHFTKLEPRWTNVIALCTSFCNATRNNNAGFCPAPCLLECPTTCQYVLMPPTTAAVASSSARSPGRVYTLDPLFIATFACLATGLLAMCTYAVYLKYYSMERRRRRSPGGPRSGQEAEHESNSLGSEGSVIGAATLQMYSKGDALFREMECAVCLNELQDGEVMRILPKCNHAFHMSCIDVWLGSHISCPMCRACIVSSKATEQHHMNPPV